MSMMTKMMKMTTSLVLGFRVTKLSMDAFDLILIIKNDNTSDCLVIFMYFNK